MTGPKCGRGRAVELLALYDARVRGGYANQQIAARERVARITGMTVRDLRRWLRENPDNEEN